MTSVSALVSFSPSRNGLRLSVWILLLSASKSASCTSLRASSPFRANRCSLTWPLTMSLSHLWKTRWSKRPRVASQDISRASLDSKVNQDRSEEQRFYPVLKEKLQEVLGHKYLQPKPTEGGFTIFFPMFCVYVCALTFSPGVLKTSNFFRNMYSINS